MSFVATIDTLQFFNRMQKAGLDKKISDELAEAIKETQSQFISQSLENVVTKQDILTLESKIDHEIKLVKSEIKNSMLTTIISLGTIMALIEKFIN